MIQGKIKIVRNTIKTDLDEFFFTLHANSKRNVIETGKPKNKLKIGFIYILGEFFNNNYSYIYKWYTIITI